MTAPLLVESPATQSSDGDHERFSHYVSKEQLEASWLTGEPCIALCGKVWLPSKDPKRFPVCPECKELHDQLEPGGPDDVD